MIQLYLQTGQLSSTNIPPVLFKRLMEERIKRNKKEPEEEKVQMFEVNLISHSSSEKIRVKSNSFQGAARNALMRRQKQLSLIHI